MIFRSAHIYGQICIIYRRQVSGSGLNCLWSKNIMSRTIPYQQNGNYLWTQCSNHKLDEELYIVQLWVSNHQGTQWAAGATNGSGYHNQEYRILNTKRFSRTIARLQDAPFCNDSPEACVPLQAVFYKSDCSTVWKLIWKWSWHPSTKLEFFCVTRSGHACKRTACTYSVIWYEFLHQVIWAVHSFSWNEMKYYSFY